MLSHQLQDAIESYLSTTSTKQLSEQFERLSQGYRQFKNEDLGSKKEDVDAYLVGRFPSTLAVLKAVFSKIETFLPETFRVIDYGCGPATTLCALNEVFLSSRFTYTGIEEKKAMLDAGKYLAQALHVKAEFLHQVVEKTELKSSYDIAVASYLLNELSALDPFFDKLLQHETILVVEPGTPDGTNRILKLRAKAIEKGYHVLLPCPHQLECPYKKPHWCHFYERVERTKIQRSIKHGSLGYEDEKYAYVFLSKTKLPLHNGVLVEKPDLFPYKTTLKVCASDGSIQTQEILKKDKEQFKKAKRLSWGDFI